MPSTWDRSKAETRLREITRAYAATPETKTASGAVRHKCFISYHSADAVEVLDFVETYEGVLIPRAVGVSEDAPWIDSEDDGYIFDTIRDEYLADSTVTIALIGRCTWARKFIDWEVYSTLRQDRVNRLNGLLALRLPSVAGGGGSLPIRVRDNVIRGANKVDLGYGRYYVYPSSERELRGWIDDAFEARSSRRHLIRNERSRKRYNDMC
jgi:hypothetical protein